MDISQIDQNSYQYILQYRSHTLRCAKRVHACEVLEKVQAGNRVILAGYLRENQYGKKELVIQQVDKVVKTTSWWWRDFRLVGRLRERLLSITQKVLSEPEADWLAVIVLGQSSQMPKDFYDDLVATGTLHIIAGSGFNVTIVAKVAMGVLTLVMSRVMVVVVAIGVVIGDVILAGGNAAVVRAGIMGSLAFTAEALGKDYWAVWGLIISTLVMLLVAPWLWVSVSFQLSVAATAGIVWGEKRIGWGIKKTTKKLLVRLKKARINGLVESLQGDLSTTLAATLATLPITVVTFGRLSVLHL